MSRDYITDPAEDVAFSQRRIVSALERIADYFERVERREQANHEAAERMYAAAVEINARQAREEARHHSEPVDDPR